MGICAAISGEALAIEITQTSGTNPRFPVPKDIQPPRSPAPEPIEPLQLPPANEILKPTPKSKPEEIPLTSPELFIVNEFNFVGSTVFSEEQLREATISFVGRPLSFAELQQAASAITQLYVNSQYITSGAYLPPQKIEAGVVTITIVEGTLEEIIVLGTERINPGYIRERIESKTGKPLNRAELISALQLLQINPQIESISSQLKKGSQPGTNILEVEVSEASSFGAGITLDNARSPSIGSFRQSLTLNAANLAGETDNLTAFYAHTKGSHELNSSYTVPVNPQNGTIRVSYRFFSSQVIEPPFDVLNIESESREYSLSFRQPLIENIFSELAAGVNLSHQQSEVSLDEQPFPSRGTDERGRTRISTLRFFQEWTKRGEGQVFLARSEFNWGIDALDATINESGPDGQFFIWRGQILWAKLLAEDTTFLLRSQLQLAERELPGLEQFTIGGINSVRGYRTNQIVTDNGISATAELRFPVYKEDRSKILLQLGPFIDVGTGWNNSEIELEQSTLVSVGLTMELLLKGSFSARIDWAVPLIDVNQRGNSLQEKGLYFRVNLEI